MTGLQEEGRGDEPVVRDVQVEPVGQRLGLGLDVLEDGVDVAGDPDSEGDVAVGAQPLQAPVGSGNLVPEQARPR